MNDELRITAGRILATLPSARLACLNVLKLGRMTIDRTLDEHGHNKHVDRLVALRHWAEPLKLDDDRLTAHVLEAVDPASAILEFAQASRVDHILIGARRNSVLRTLVGSVSAKVASEATCTVTDRPRRGRREAAVGGAGRLRRRTADVRADWRFGGSSFGTPPGGDVTQAVGQLIIRRSSTAATPGVDHAAF